MYRLNRGLEKVEYKKTGTIGGCDYDHGTTESQSVYACQKPHCDAVDHPAHYCSHPSGIECIEITKHHDFCTGNAIKYLFRAGIKGGPEKRIEDLRKAKKYIEFAIEDEEKRGICDGR